MKHRPFVTAVATAVLAGVAANCGGHPNRSNLGTGSGGIALTSPSPIVVSLSDSGPPTIAPGQTVQFTATAALSNGTTADYTRNVTWYAYPTTVLTITRDGLATGQANGDATILAVYQGTGSCCRGTNTSVIVPANTYRLTGKAVESGLPVAGATIAVLSGIGAGLSATTDSGGSYRVYGVAGTIQIKFSKPGYDDVVKTFTAVQNDVLDFPDVRQTARIPSLAGAYTLSLTADPTCPTVPTGIIAVLADEFRRPRSYAATLTQNGPSVTVTLTDPQIVKTHNQFSGRVDPDGIEFGIGATQPYYDYYYGAVIEQVSATQGFEFHGQVRAPRNGSAVSGSLTGGLALVTLGSYAVLTQCVASNHQLTLTPAAQPSGRRR